MSSHPIEILIGADLYGFILLDGIRAGSANEPIAQNSIFGWILSGPANSRVPGQSSTLSALHCTSLDNLDRDIRSFWETEELPQRTHLTPDEQQCEDHFIATHSRDSTGRYIVRLPFKGTTPLNIGESRRVASTMLSRHESRLSRNPNLRNEYDQFLDEYARLGHMRAVPHTAPVPSQCVYIPHHAVVRDSSATTRLRVVFNASSHTSNGTSLNDHLLVGPKLQTDLSSVILRWRQYKYVLTADIAKMYRQIRVDPRDVDYQRILWRSPSSQSVEDYQLLTVTYGTAPAPYLALRVLQQLVKDEGSRFPLAIPVLRHHIYVDDCVFGADDVMSARATRDQLIALLKTAQFHLRKWASNSAALLSDLSADDHGLACDKTLQTDDSLKVLGVTWNPDKDAFQFRVALGSPLAFTKRSILSTIARLFDPLGWVTPVTVTAKIMMQKLWLLKCDWDALLPGDIQNQWHEYYTQLPHLRQLQIPRWTEQHPSNRNYELHGFADASSVAYAAVVYLRVTTNDDRKTISLLAAKSKVAPVKPLTIPRLELSAALLLSRLMTFVMGNLKLDNPRCYCWTDSTVALHWLSQPPASWKPFVANRVAEIQNNLPDAHWRHVPTYDNPADCASRGLLPSQLLTHELWWRGPEWLRKSEDHWPDNLVHCPSDSSLEQRSIVSVHLATTKGEEWDLAKRYSSWSKLLRVTAYVFRFIKQVRDRVHRRVVLSPPRVHRGFVSKALDSSEIHNAKYFWLRHIQKEVFPEEYHCLHAQCPLPKKSCLLSLNPFFDEHNLIRVGGRLKNSKLPDQTKCPIILKNNSLVTLIIQNAHSRALHAGPQMTLCLLRNEYWLLRARQVVREIIFRCVPCARERASRPEQLMGNLPEVRVSRSTRAFVHCGVDYTGPIQIRSSSGRGHKSHKAYIALFVCLVVKAVHLELVTDYSTAAFVAAYKRFCSRRGVPSTMYSDNGTTFQGADRELTQAFRAATRNTTFVNWLATERVSWHFIPPSAPHFGGLWEVGVRSVKYHLKRVIGAHTLTYEEFTTLLCQIEACLNSRPIAQLSDNLDDYNPLTPGHFLIGSALNAVPEPSLLEINESRLSRWQLVQKTSESFWQRWSQDYMQNLQQRIKWRRLGTNIASGQMVLLRNSNAPPCKWELGRVTACHPGNDGLVRVVTVKTATSELKRPIEKLCILPIPNPPVETSREQ